MKIIFVGCTHAGTNCAVTIKKICPDAEIHIIEKNSTVSFLSCGIAIGCQLQTPLEGMFYCSVAEMNKMGIKTHMESLADEIDYSKKCLTVKPLNGGASTQLNYDILVLSCGSAPIIPPFIPNGDVSGFKNLYLCKSYVHGTKIFEYVKAHSGQGKSVAVLGGGYIGIELCECFGEHKFKVYCVEGEERIMKRYFDKDFTDKAEETLKKHSCEIVLGKRVTNVEQAGEQIKLTFNDNSNLTVDACVMCIGFKPNTEFAIKSAEKQKVTLKNDRGAFEVTEFCETTQADVYAIGDASMCFLNPMEKQAYIPLATNAIRQAIACGSHICHKINPKIPLIPQIGTQGTSALKLYDLVFSSTGLSTELAKQTYGDDVADCKIEDDMCPGFITPNLGRYTLRMVYRRSDFRLLGVQVIGQRAAEICQAASVLIQNKASIFQVMQQDFSFNPWYNKPVHPLAQCAMKIIFG